MCNSAVGTTKWCGMLGVSVAIVMRKTLPTGILVDSRLVSFIYTLWSDYIYMYILCKCSIVFFLSYIYTYLYIYICVLCFPHIFITMAIIYVCT